MPETPDDEILAGCVAGRKAAWDAFVERYARLVYWSVRKTLANTAFAGRADLAEDAFQEVFRKLLEGDGLARLREAKSLPKYLSVLAAHLALDRVKSLSRREARHEPLPADDAPPAWSAPSASDEAAARERERVLAETLATLDARERFCVELCYLDGRTHREIALLLGVPQDTVSTVIRRTREKLKTRLEERGLGAAG